MPELPVVTVRGTARLEVDPEVATLAVRVRAEDKSRAGVLKRINKRGEALDATAKRFQEAVEGVETAAVRLTPVFKGGDRPRERVVGYAATVVKRLNVTDFSRLGELLAQLANLELMTVDGPWWSLRPDSPVYRQARIAAVHDAVAQARDYAAAIGSELAGLVELSDTGLLGGHEGRERFYAAPAAAFGSGPPQELTFDIEPEAQTVQEHIEARFRITAPELKTE